MAAKTDLTAQSIPEVASVDAGPTQPDPSEYKGVYRNIAEGDKGFGLLYELAALPSDKSDPKLKTHRLRVPAQPSRDKDGKQLVDKDGNPKIDHPGFYWEGTKDQFKDHFEKA